MKKISGILILLVGIFLGLYIGIYISLYGGIVQLIDAWQISPKDSSGIAWGIMKLMFSPFIGYSSLLMCIYSFSILEK